MAQIHQPQLVLASASPRRAEILRTVGWTFTVQPADVDETRRTPENAVEYVERLALEKALAVARQITSGLVLGADTVVVLNDEILGKPVDEADAQRLLRALSGRWHEVVTGVALAPAGGTAQAVAHERTRVKFSVLTEEEIAWYAATDEPLDKAGAYAVQGLAALFITGLEGDYWNVMGLPVGLLYRLLKR